MSQKLDFPVFFRLPQKLGTVKTCGLEKEHEADPLIILMMGNVFRVVSQGSNPRIRYVFSRQMRGDREGGVDPAVRVHDVGRDPVYDAVDGVAEELLGSDEEAGAEEDDGGELVVEAKHVTVDADVVRFEQVQKWRELIEHLQLKVFKNFLTLIKILIDGFLETEFNNKFCFLLYQI